MRHTFWLLGAAAVCFGQPASPVVAQAVASLKTNCSACHSQANRSGRLALDTRDDALKGGARGPAITPGKASDSLLIQAVEQTGSLKCRLAARS